MSKKISILLFLLLISFVVSIAFVAINFNQVKERYHEIEPNLDNYSAGEILSLSFEKARTSLLRGDLDDYLIKTNIIGSKITILENRSTLSDAFYHSDEFLRTLDVLKSQYSRLKELNSIIINKKDELPIILEFMDSMDSTIIELLEIVYKIQISNFNEVNEIINGNSKKAEWFSILSLFLGFLIVFVSLCDILYLRDLLKKKNVFISSIYHELASSAQAIVMCTDIMESEIKENELKEEVQRISHHTNKIIEQTKEVFDYSKIEMGVAKVHASSFYMMDLFNDLLLSLSGQNANILKIKFSASVSKVKIITDRYKLFRIIMNLMDNANKYTSNGMVFLNVKIRKNKLIIRVKDTGEGFNIKELNNLYKAFNQGSEKMTRQGLGLGLTIVKSYVKLLGGKIRVNSRIGTGSMFLIVIPLVLAKEEL